MTVSDCCVFVNSGRVVWTENVWCVFRVKPPSSIFSGLVWTERNICFVPGFKSRFQTRFVKPKPKYPLCYAIGLEYLRHFLIQSEVKPKPLVTRSHAFFPRFSSAAVFALGFGWFTLYIYIHIHIYTRYQFHTKIWKICSYVEPCLT